MTRASSDAKGRLDHGPPIAVIDIGSNSVRLVVYEGLTRSPTPLFNEKALCGLGREQPGRLHFAAQPAQRLLVEQRGRAAREPLVDDEAHGIRADIDNGEWRTAIETCGSGFRRCVGHLFKSAGKRH